MRRYFIAFSILSLFFIQTGCEITEKTVEKTNESDSGTGELSLDTDGDGLADSVEVTLGTDPDKPDTDGDGLTDGSEVLTHSTNPLVADTDQGGIDDGSEVTNGTNPRESGDDFDPQNAGDVDEDGLSYASEIFIGTDPTNPDTDGDGLSDGAEVKTYFTSPLIKDTDNGGIDDGKEVDFGTNPLDTNDDRLPDPPSIVFTSTPADPTTDTSATFQYQLVRFSNIQRVECRIDGEFLACDPETDISLDNFEVGEHSFSVLVMTEEDEIFSSTYRWEVQEPVAVDPCDPSRVTTEARTVTFEAPSSTCDFGIGDNSAKKNGFLTAYREQEFSIELPENTKLCGLDIDIQSQSFRYDDDFALTWNGFAITGNGSDILTEDGENTKFDWDAVKDKKFGNDQVFCLGENLGSNCTVPGTDRNGTIEIDLNSTAMTNLIGNFADQREHRMSLVTTGDNDNSDCKHTGLEVDLSISYGTL